MSKINMSTVSVIIPTYNAAKYISATINSVLDQKFSDIEIIVVDDFSTDNTKEIIERIGSDKIQYYCLDKNHGGPSVPRNFGIQKARGEFVALCDSDDLVTPDRISSAVKFLRNHPDLGMVFTDEQKFADATGKDLGNFLAGYDRFNSLPKQDVGSNCFVISPEDCFSCLFFENFIMPSGVTIRSDIFKEIGTFDDTLTNGDDWDFWFRLTREHAIGFIKIIGFRYRIRTNSISSRGVSLIENRSKVIRKQIATGLPRYLYNRCQKMIAQNYFGIGYHFQKQCDMRKARNYYLKSLRTSFSREAFKGLLISFLGANVYLALRKAIKLLER